MPGPQGNVGMSDKAAAARTMVSASVTVEPLDRQQTNMDLRPAPEAEARVELQRAIEATNYFAQAVLLHEGRISHTLLGNNVVNGVISSSTENTGIYRFSFPGLRVPVAGEYSLRVDVYEMDELGANHVSQVESREFQVVDATSIVNGAH